MESVQDRRERELEYGEMLLKQAKPRMELEVFDAPTVEALKEAMQLFEKWEVKEKMAETYEYWGKYLMDKEEFNSVKAYYQKSLDIRLKFLGEKHESIGEIHRLFGELYVRMNDFQNAQNYIEKALEISLSLFGEEHFSTARCYDSMGNLLFEQNQSKEALFHAQKALSLTQKLPRTSPFFWGKLYNLLSSIYHALGDYEKTKQFIEKGMSLYEDILPPTHKQFGTNYYNLSYFYYGVGEYSLALLYMKKALTLFEHHQTEGMYSIWAYHSLQMIYSSQNKNEAAVEIGEKALAILKRKGSLKNNLSILIIRDLGVSYASLNSLQKALEHLQSALQLAIEMFGENSMPVASLQYLCGKSHLMNNHFTQAQNYFEQSLRILEKLPNAHINHYLNNWGGLGVSFSHSKTPNYRLALHFAHKAMMHSIENYDNDDVYDYPSLDILNLIAVYIEYTMRVINKAVLFLKYYEEETRSTKDLEAAFQGFEVAIHVSNQIRQSFQSEFAKLKIIQKMQHAMIDAFRTAYTLYQVTNSKDYLQYCFRLSEKDKAYLLLMTNREKNAQKNIKIPPNLLQKENDLKTKLVLLQKSIQVQQQKRGKENKIILQSYQNDYLDTHQAFEKLRKQFKTDYPNYHYQKYSTDTVSIKELKKSLTDKQTVLSYFIGEEKIYLFVITREEFEVLPLAKPQNWTELIQSYLESIKFHQKEKFHQLSFKLYQTLLQEAAHHLVDPFEEEPKQVFIIPHAELHYLPFETLIIQEADTSKSYQDLDYLLNHCEISYHYSATLLHLDLQKQAVGEPASTEMTFTGFAPVYSSTSSTQQKALEALQKEPTAAVNRSEAVRGDGTWMPLPYSKIEVEAISQLFEKQGYKNQSFLYGTATKSNLEKQIGNSRFVLIAAHGIVNDEYPELSGLVLAENKTIDDEQLTVNKEQKSMDNERSLEQTPIEDCILNMKEVSMIPMSADLVVLSSCESGIGELHKGEGMMAVNRGFLASGAKNVVSTLFKVNDKASSELTTLLFQYILEGENYGTALQKAKLDLLKKTGMSPKAWSGFVLFGKGV